MSRSPEIAVRPASASDLPALDRIYHHYVRTSHATFDIETRPRDDWFAAFDGARYRCLLATTAPAVQNDMPNDDIVGYACSYPFKARRAYETSVETSVYLAPEATQRGIGARLYEALFESLREEDLHRAYAGISLPNDASLALHRRFGFEQVAHYHEVGRKFGRYWDVIWLERALPG